MDEIEQTPELPWVFGPSLDNERVKHIHDTGIFMWRRERYLRPRGAIGLAESQHDGRICATPL